jgi:hypothetical protein
MVRAELQSWCWQWCGAPIVAREGHLPDLGECTEDEVVVVVRCLEGFEPVEELPQLVAVHDLRWRPGESGRCALFRRAGARVRPRWACSSRRRATRDATWNQVIFWLTGGSAGRVLTKVRIEENSNCYCILPRQDWPCCYSFSTPHER